MRGCVYADNAATSATDECALEAMLPYLKYEYANPSSVYSFSSRSAEAVDRARKTISRCINCLPEEIYFTSGGTEGDNTAVKCAAVTGKSIITSPTEHKAVLNSCRAMERNGFSVYYTDVRPDGTVDAAGYSELLKNNPGLVSVMTANNETGTIQDIAELSSRAHAAGALFHTDAVQACGHIPVDVKKLGADLLSASAHKFNGPKGVGFLYVKKGTPLTPLIDGGGQENGLRGGTLNVAGIAGMAAALENNCLCLQKNAEYISSLEKRFFDGLCSLGVGFVRNGGGLPGLLSISFHGRDSEALLHRLDLMGIAVSSGAACDSRQTQISHVLAVMKVPAEYAQGTLRFSFGKYNTPEDIDKILSSLGKILTDTE